MLKDKEMNENLFKSKENFLHIQKETMSKILSKGKAYERKIKYHNLNFNPENYKYRELIPTVITDKYYLLEEEYKKKSIPFSPFLINPPVNLNPYKEAIQKENDFDYYKRHILLETYDEEPEAYGEITQKINSLRQNDPDLPVNGYTKWLEDDQHVWRKCKLISYDEKEKLFSISVTYENLKKETQDIFKKVTRFNFLFEGESLEDLNRRVELAKKWKFYAKKYVAFYHFVSNVNLTNAYDAVTPTFMEKIITLAFIYRGTSKPQLTPIQYDRLQRSEKFGIWRRHSRKRQVDVDKKKLVKVLNRIGQSTLEDIKTQIQELNYRSYQMIEFYKQLPLNFHLYDLLADVIPNEKFLLPCEFFLKSHQPQGMIPFHTKRPFINVFEKIEHKLHQSEFDSTTLLDFINRKFAEELNFKIFFYKNWLVKPITLNDFQTKNEENILFIFKEINFIIGHSSYEIINFIKERQKEAKKINKGATIPPHVIAKFRRFENLLNRRVGNFARENFHSSMNYITQIWKNVNLKISNVLPGKEFTEFTMDDFISIRDDYNLQYDFEVNFEDLQFSFELKYEKSQFAIEPSFNQWWKTIEGLIRNQILIPLNNITAINVYDLLSLEEQNNFYVSSEMKITVFFEDDQSYEERIAELKGEMEKFFSLLERFLQLLNTDIKNNLTELLSFSKDIKTNNINEESLNIEHFRYFIKMVKHYLSFFSETFKYEDFFLGGILIKTKATNDYWLNRLSDIKDQLFKLIIDNNVYLSKEMEALKEKIEAKLEEDPGSVDEYDSLNKYCDNLNMEMKGIWDRINSQQENANLLEENFYLLKREDFFRMWQCYGIPRHLHMKKQETLSKLTNDRKKFKKELKQRYFNTITEISKIKNDFETMTIITDIDSYDDTFKFFSSHKFKIEKMMKQCSVLNEHQMIIGVKTSDLSEIKEIYNSFINYYYLWESVFHFISGSKNWMEDPLKKIDRRNLKTIYDNCINTIDRLEKSVFRRDKPAPYKVIQLLREKIKEFQPFLPVLYDLINPDFKPNHIADLSKAIGVPFPEDLNINFIELINRGIMDKIDEISDRSSYATGQKKLNANLDKAKEKYKALKVELVYYKGTDLLILKDVELLTDEIDELLTKVVAMSSSKFAKYLIKDIQNIWNNLAKAQEIIEIWMKVQKLLCQIHQIFIYGDLKKQLVDEFQKYESIDKQWRIIMDLVRTSPQIIEVIQISKIKEILTKSFNGLEEITKSLIAYLNTKRDVFPRFYFVSNEELTMMLAQSGEPTIIAERYIQQVFEGIKRLEVQVDDEAKRLDSEVIHIEVADSSKESNTSFSFDERVVIKTFSSMISEQGEIVQLDKHIQPYETHVISGEKITKSSMLEKWLTDLEKEMQSTLKKNFLLCYEDLLKGNKREDWVGSHIEQAILTISQLDWTTRTTNALIEQQTNSRALKELLHKDNSSLSNLIRKIRTENLPRLVKKTLVSLIIQDVHANDVIKYLIDSEVNNASAFEWISQLRYYTVNIKGKEVTNITEVSGIGVRMLNTERPYDFEYLGNQKRLVITPLTDRCYRTMMEAMNNCLGGAPEGPAGTGKTETIKDLSRNLGKKCFTYNCSEDSDYILMTKFFKGIAMSGCWVCFDEFNRISLDVLSVIAHQISILLTSLKARTPTCLFDGAQIPFNFNMGIFITMNPDYAGRSELPDNLKGLFRPLAMMIPDYAMITEIMLYSFGFDKARDLSRKIVSSLKLASEQLSSQTHYDYGMRALTAIINYVGNLSSIKNKEESNSIREEYLVQKAIRDSNMPKFIADDYKIYEGILSDLFPSVDFENESNEILLTTIKEKCNELNLYDCKYLIEKVIDFNNVMSVRHAVMIVGSAMSNKSSILKVFQTSIPEYYSKTNQNKSIKSQIINPKSITSAQLFGYVNKKTLEFHEGVCSKTLREYFAEESSDLKMLVFDGPVDTMWIENMNSVLDDTKKLCLENSDQIRLDENTFIVFEVDDLSQASLATISRCGMVYTDRSNIDCSPYFYAWLRTLPPSYIENNFTELIRALLESYYLPLMNDFLFDEYHCFKFKTSVPVYKNWLMLSFVKLLESLIFSSSSKQDMIDNENEAIRQSKEQADPDVLIVNETKSNVMNTKKNLSKTERMELFNKFIYAMIVNFTSVFDLSKEQRMITEKIFEINQHLIGQNFIMKEELLNFGKIHMDKGRDFLDQIYCIEENAFLNVNELITRNSDTILTEIRNCFAEGNSVIIPSVSTYKAFNVLKLCHKSITPVMLYGTTASGKTLLIKDYLIKHGTNPKWINATFILNSKTSANNICDLIEEKISFKLKKNTVAPQNNKNCLIVIEDLNMPAKEKYGAQPAIEILRQLFDYGGWYDRKEKDFLYLKNLLIFTCLTMGRPLVSDRLLWHFLPVQMNEVDEHTMKNIFSQYFAARFLEYSPSIRKLQDSFVDTIIQTYSNVIKAFRPLPATPHYAFNLRDITKIFEGLAMVPNEMVSTRIDQSDYMAHLLLHEATRVFYDRLANETDRSKFKNQIYVDIQLKLFKKAYPLHDNLIDSLLFTEINQDYSYQKVEDSEKLKQDIYVMMDDYNYNKKQRDKINLILFDYSLKHLLRIDRILSRTKEHGVLVGLTGSGRQSLCNVAAFIKKFKIFRTRTKEEVDEYGHREWLKDIQELYLNAGIKRETTMFLIKDTNISDEKMYVDLNCMISGGSVYNLFANEEKVELIANLKQMKEFEDMNLTDDHSYYEAFLSKAMQRCRVILCMNPLSVNFTKCLRSFPSLINNTSIDWYEAWPESALYYLAQREISKEVEADQIDDVSYIFSKAFTSLNETNEEYYKQTRKKVIILPKSFLDFLSFFKSFHAEYYHKTDKDILKYKEGVKKIDEAGVQIKIMSELLEVKRPQLVEQSKFMEITMKEIEIQKIQTEEFQKQCEENEQIALRKREEAEYKKKIAMFNMQEAERIKADIYKKIMLIDNKQFMALRSYRVPPKEVTKMMGAICVIMSNFEKKPLEVIPKEWDYYKKKLNDVKLLKVLEGLPKKLETNLLGEKVLKLLEPLVKDPDLDPNFMEKKISSTCGCFCFFIQNMYLLDEILKTKIIPSTKESEEATKSFMEAQASVDYHKKNLMEVTQKLEALNDEFNQRNFEKQQLELEISDGQKKLQRAQRLTNKLSGEKKRWAEVADELEKKKIFVFGDIIISSIYISFLGPFLTQFRESFIKEKIFPLLDDKNINFSHIHSVSKLIGNANRIQDWIINGLPPDSGSVDSGMVLFETKRPVLLIDPQKQAMKFLTKMYKNDLIMHRPTEPLSSTPTMIRDNIMENSIRTGKVLIFDYVSYDVCLEADSLLDAEEIVSNGVKFFRIGQGTEIPVHPKFKFFLVSYNTNPDFNPELYGRISIINFTVTKPGLTEQLLSLIVKEESPGDEIEKVNIMQKKFLLTETLNKQEEEILERLGVSSETLLDNDSLILNLEECKKFADEATVQIQYAKLTEERIDSNRMIYLPLANLGTIIYFVISELSYIENIYQFSITWFTKEILIQSIKLAGEKPLKTAEGVLEKRITALKSSLIKRAYQVVCRSLLNKDKIIFSLLLLIRKLEADGAIDEDETQFLFKDFVKVEETSSAYVSMIQSCPSFIEKLKWSKLVKLSHVTSFNGLVENVITNQEKWKDYLTKGILITPFDLPIERFDELPKFKKLLLLKIFNLEGLINCIRKIISEELDEELNKESLFSINDLLDISNYQTPLMLIMTPGVDPSNEVKKIAEENNKELMPISLGQGQSKKALENIEFCQRKGIWVYLQNLHLVPEFMKNLEQIINSLQSNDKDVNTQFRLWISCLPSKSILSSVLVNSNKITLEPPSGVKSKLVKLLKSQEKIWQYDHDNMKRIGKDYEFTRLFVCLMHFHSILLERKNFGPIGWNISYNFNDSDFFISKNILKNNLEKFSQSRDHIPFKAIIYLTADCIYGGRVTDDWDRRTLYSLLNDMYNESVLNEDDYCVNKVKEYSVPYHESYEAYLKKFHDELPTEESPEILGLHANTLIRKQKEQSNELLLSFAKLDQNESRSASFNKAGVLTNLIDQVNKKLIKEFKVNEIKKKYPLLTNDCMNSILIQEIMRYNSLLSLVHSSLDEAVNAYLGHTPMTDEIEETSNQIIANRVPTKWINASYPSRKPIASWINDLEQRIKFFTRWVDEGVPQTFWFSAFYFTHSFLTGIKQNYARRHKISIDKLEFNFTYTEDYDHKDNYDYHKGYLIYGLYIEGAEWNRDKHCIDELTGRKVSAQMPLIIISVKALDNDQSVTNKDMFIYKSPVYKCSTRQGSLSTTGHSTNYIFTMNLPSLVDPNHWVKRGVAVLNQLDD